MIRHLLQLVWNQRRQNGWLWVELLLVSVFLWFLVDSLYVLGRTRMAPLGFDIEHTYQVCFGDLADTAPGYLPKESRAEGDTDGARLLEVLDRMRAYPGVEAVCYSHLGMPYAMGASYLRWQLDTLNFSARRASVSPDYFKVFRVADQEGDAERLASAMRDAGSDGVIVSENVTLEAPDFHLSIGQRLTNSYWKDQVYHLAGVCRAIRRCEYERADPPVLFLPFTPSRLADGSNDGSINTLEICLRVRPEADDADFVRRFRADMAKQARVGNIYLLDVVPVSDAREGYLRMNGLENEAKTRAAIALFLLVNIFLGIIGTFWFRTEYRKGEMGLRMALGSTRGGLGTILLGEGCLLLILAFIPALVISSNIALTDLVEKWLLPFDWTRFVLCQSITFILILLMIACGIWYPARQTARLEPAEALRYE